AELAEAASRDPAIAAELARSQEFDAAVGGALNDLPVPGDLEARLLAALQSGAVGSEVTLPPSTVEHAAQRFGRRKLTRRRLMMGGGAVALGGRARAFAVQFWRLSHQLVGNEELASSVAAWIDPNRLP